MVRAVLPTLLAITLGCALSVAWGADATPAPAPTTAAPAEVIPPAATTPSAPAAAMVTHKILKHVKKKHPAAAAATAMQASAATTATPAAATVASSVSAPAAVSAPAPQAATVAAAPAAASASAPAAASAVAPAASAPAAAAPESAPAAETAPAAAPAPAMSGAMPQMPVRGMDMANVEHIFGAPLEKQDAVGKPPITRWVYADYVVYFEYNKVLHTVLKAAPFSSPGA
ncbi:MAG TPA: hypothetical protein VGS99_05345 [Gammaproteobacteria bacterium]|nr:hypothetical protein [Gammaproteobacteria bacterium]